MELPSGLADAEARLTENGAISTVTAAIDEHSDAHTLVVTPDSPDVAMSAYDGTKDEAHAAVIDTVVKLAFARADFHCTLCSASYQPILRPVMLVGVSGPSCSGKSTVAAQLTAQLGSPLLPINADNYFDTARMKQCKGEWSHATDYELPSSVAWDILLDDLHRLASVLSRAAYVPEQLHLACPAKWALASNVVAHEQAGCMLTSAPIILVVEGFLLFACQALTELCAERFFLVGAASQASFPIDANFQQPLQDST